MSLWLQLVSQDISSSWLFSTSILAVILLGVLLFSEVLSLSTVLFEEEAEIFNFLLKNSIKPIMFFLSLMIIALCVFHWARHYMGHGNKLMTFYTLLFLFVCSMLILVLSDSFFAIFLGWEGLGVTSYLLIVFYQNWSSASGGLLTLLTNRIGDGVLMISFAYWISSLSMDINKSSSLLLLSIFLILSMTKSAQVPFTSWLPAAMAAPTPVSALVHSSTLVTAGIWLMIRFSQATLMNSALWWVFGFFTLLTASFMALVETDMKKIVALSTLSQLGLMYLTLFSGGFFICFFHLLTHAFAKANLFLMVGNLIHLRFSQQDSRLISPGLSQKSVSLMIFISVLSLSGVLFTSSFFSKDLALSSSYFLMSSMWSSFILVSIITLTMSYCFNLLKLSFKSSLSSSLMETSSSMPSVFPSIILSSLSLFFGSSFILSFLSFKLTKPSLSGLYWMVLLLFPLVLVFLGLNFWKILFFEQVKLLSLSSSFLLKMMSSTTFNFSSLLESILLTNSLKAEAFLWSFSRIFMLVSLFSLVFFLF